MTKPLEIVHSDICGPMKMIFIVGARYFILFIVEFSQKVWLYVLKSKGSCIEKFKQFKGIVEMQLEHKIKIFQSDNDKEFVSKACNQFLKDHGIEKQMSTMHTPQHNGVV